MKQFDFGAPDWAAALQAALWALHWDFWQLELQYLAFLQRPHLRVPGLWQEGLEQVSAMMAIWRVWIENCWVALPSRCNTFNCLFP